MSSSTNGICVAAANADVSATVSIVVADDWTDTFLNEVLCGTNGDAVSVATVDLALIKPNLDLSTITAESRGTVGTCIRLLLLQHVWGRSLDGQCPITESINLCFRTPPRQPRFVGSRTEMLTLTNVHHVVAPRRDAQECRSS